MLDHLVLQIGDLEIMKEHGLHDKVKYKMAGVKNAGTVDIMYKCTSKSKICTKRRNKMRQLTGTAGRKAVIYSWAILNRKKMQSFILPLFNHSETIVNRFIITV